VKDLLIDVFAEGLGVDPGELSDESSPENTFKWDSLAAMRLVVLIEDTYNVQLSTVDIMRMRSIGVARAVLQEKGVDGI